MAYKAQPKIAKLINFPIELFDDIESISHDRQISFTSCVIEFLNKAVDTAKKQGEQK
jgi:rRNA-processing protein FCF1